MERGRQAWLRIDINALDLSHSISFTSVECHTESTSILLDTAGLSTKIYPELVCEAL